MADEKSVNKKTKDNTQKLFKAMSAAHKEYFRIKAEGLKKDVVANTPVKTGNLRNHVAVVPLTTGGGKIETGIEVTGVSYAMKVHESPDSKLQGNTPEGGVGRKFIERVMQTNFGKKNEKDISTELKKVGMDLKKLA